MANLEEQVLAEVQRFKIWADEKLTSGIHPLREEINRAVAMVTKLQEHVDSMRRSQLLNMSENGRVLVTDGPFTGLDLLELRMCQTLLTARYARRPDSVRESTIRALREAR